MEIEGLRKYSIDHTKKPIYLEGSDFEIFQELLKVREFLYQDKLVGVDESGQGYGNLSIRLKSGGCQFLVSGSQTGGVETANLGDFVVIEEYDLSAFSVKSCGLAEPSSESLTHGAIYEQFTHIQSVIHIHSFNLWKYMIDSEKYPVSREVEYGTKEMIEEIGRIFPHDSKTPEGIFAMKGHTGGIVSFASSPTLAYSLIESVREAQS